MAMQAMLHLRGIELKSPELVQGLRDKLFQSFSRLKLTFNSILKSFFILLLGFKDALKISYMTKTNISRKRKCNSKKNP